MLPWAAIRDASIQLMNSFSMLAPPCVIQKIQPVNTRVDCLFGQRISTRREEHPVH